MCFRFKIIVLPTPYYIKYEIFVKQYNLFQEHERTCAARVGTSVSLSDGDVFLIRRFVVLVPTCFLFTRS